MANGKTVWDEGPQELIIAHAMARRAMQVVCGIKSEAGCGTVYS